MAEFNYEILRKIAVLSETGKQTKELNLISFNGKEPKYDLRNWKNDEDGRKMYRGITLTEGELHALKQAIAEI